MKTQFNHIVITSVFKGNKLASFDNMNYNRYVITLHNTVNGVNVRFNFWGSVKNPKMEEKDSLLLALQCFLSDSVTANQSFDSFCNDCGYDTDNMRAYKTYKTCKNYFDKALSLLGNEIDVYALYKAINDLGL